ncbi:MAG: hypothetical protein P9L92_00610 [Candidatus Electryonea clarkiae]|nr:hypothetical protein [Candidatus Electryonea clarkiae]MDP8287080.1 hypothetical protein [Candidatus Electryonea clarkiae]
MGITKTGKASITLKKRRGDNPKREIRVQEELAKLRIYHMIAQMREA